MGEVAAFVTNEIEALRLPTAVGVNVTLNEQDAEAASVDPQVLPLIAKSPAFAPPIEMLVMLSVAEPVFCRVSSCEELLNPSDTDPNDIEIGERLTDGPLVAPHVITTRE